MSSFHFSKLFLNEPSEDEFVEEADDSVQNFTADVVSVFNLKEVVLADMVFSRIERIFQDKLFLRVKGENVGA